MIRPPHPRPSRWAARAAAAAAGLLATAAAVPPAADSAVTAKITVSPAPVTRPIRAGFLGLALRYDTVPQWAGKPALTQLMHNLDPAGHVLIRIGGITGDRSYWPGPGISQPRGVTYSLGPAWAASAREMAADLHGKLLLGLNLEANNAALTRYEANELLSHIGRSDIAYFSIGNEAPLYSHVPWYYLSGGNVLPWYSNTGTPVYSRPPSWDAAEYTADYAGILSALPNVPIAGPDIGSNAWYPAYDAKFVSPHSRVRMLVSHGYGLNTCVTATGSPSYPTIDHLLGRYASDTLLRGLRPSIAKIHQDGGTFRIDEMGSVTCNGKPGVADTMASALWAVSALFSAARAGVDGVNLHTVPNLSNDLFDIYGSTARIRPLYDGVLLFARAAPAGSRLLGIKSTGAQTVRAYATTGAGAAYRVTLVNDNRYSAATATVFLPAGVKGDKATLVRLSASSASATTGVTIGGHEVASDGVLPAPDQDDVTLHGHWMRITLPAATAGVVTVTGGR